MSDLANKIRELIANEKVTIKEAVEAMVEVQYGYFHRDNLVEELLRSEDKPEVKVKPTSIKYHPLHDPAPPFEVERVPERTESPNRILARANTACICNGCKKVVYITNTDVIDGMKVSAFIDAYSPTPGMPKIARTVEILNLDGNIAVDCPACGAMKQLYLTGGPQA